MLIVTFSFRRRRWKAGVWSPRCGIRTGLIVNEVRPHDPQVGDIVML
jgi:hypothetical protein